MQQQCLYTCTKYNIFSYNAIGMHFSSEDLFQKQDKCRKSLLLSYFQACNLTIIPFFETPFLFHAPHCSTNTRCSRVTHVFSRVIIKKNCFSLIWHKMRFLLFIKDSKIFFENFEKRSRTNSFF